jgi:DNA methylase
VAPTQDALYAGLDLDLSWSERELPERERTKHVHRLHPYLGKFIPQLVEVLLERYVPAGGRVLDPFAGSGTTLVQALESGRDAAGADIAAFNCLLMRVKTARYNEFTLEKELRDACSRLERTRSGDCHSDSHSDSPRDPGKDGAEGAVSPYVRQWYAPNAVADLLVWRSLMSDYEHADVMRVVLARAARSARRTRHFDLDFPRAPQREPYWCHKHRRECRPVERADHFLRRYALDTLARIKAFARVRARDREAAVVHGDSRELAWEGPFDAVITSPPYPGLIDYHEQHRYAYELLGLDDLREREIGAAASGTGRAARAAYVDGVAASLVNASHALRRGAPLLVVVNDRRDLYPEILERAGLRLDERLRRHVNRRTGRRAGEYFEDVLVARAR